MTILLAGLPVHWRFFVKTKLFELMPESGANLVDLFAQVRVAYIDVTCRNRNAMGTEAKHQSDRYDGLGVAGRRCL